MAFIYTSPTGLDGNPGTFANPVSLPFASSLTSPGDTVYLLSGTYNVTSDLYMAVSGTAGNPITYRSLNGRASVLINFTGATGNNIFRVYDITMGYFVFRDLTFEGNSVANAAVKADNHGHHVTVMNCIVRNMASDGLTCNDHADYISFLWNQIYHTGYDLTVGSSWGSGITINHFGEGLSGWYDSYAGFHSFIIGNIISGSTDESTHHTDGNGIITDSGGDTPPCLIANNVVYGCGGTGITTLDSSHDWVVNNTCYGNLLDDRVNVPFSAGEICANQATALDNQWINNIAYSGPGANRYAYALLNSAIATPYRNGWYGGITAGSGISAPDLANPTKFTNADPLFVSPPSVSVNNQSLTTAPWLLGNGLELQASSPYLNAGIDPRTVPGVTSDYLTGLNQYVMTDINGATRGVNGAWDMGAYEQYPVATNRRVASWSISSRGRRR